MKTTSHLLSTAAVALFAAAIFTVSALAQDMPVPQPAPQPPLAPAPVHREMHNFPAPTNLQVLPKNYTGREVHEIMERWAGALGVHCDFCHVAVPNSVGPNGWPRMNFADDSKPNKKIARIMYTMTQQINKDYITGAMDLDPDGMGSPVTCGTCHRGHHEPEDFVIPREEHHDQPPTPPAAGATVQPK